MSLASPRLQSAILTGRTLIGDEPFAVILADDLCDNNDDDPVLKQMVEVYEKYRCCVVAIEEVPKEETNKYLIQMQVSDLYTHEYFFNPKCGGCN